MIEAPPTDPIFEVVGVTAADLLTRIDSARAGLGMGTPPMAESMSLGRVWRLVDFGDGTDGDFVEAAHQVMLSRPPRAAERQRRLHDLEAGSSRLAVLARLALCPEGRRIATKPVRGPLLRALVAAGRALDRVASRGGRPRRLRVRGAVFGPRSGGPR